MNSASLLKRLARAAAPSFIAASALLSAAAAQWFNALVGAGLGEEDSIAVLKLFERLG